MKKSYHSISSQTTSKAGNVSFSAIFRSFLKGINALAEVLSGTKKRSIIFAMLAVMAISLAPGSAHAQIPLYDTGFQPLNLKFNSATRVVGGSSTAQGAVHVYSNVITVEGESIDAIVRTIELSNRTISNGGFDPDAEPFVADNSDENWFIIRLSNTSGNGYAKFEFEFIEAGSYVDEDTYDPVILQNVIVNSFDIDGSGSNGTNQFTEFGGFNSSLLSGATLLDPSFNESTGLTKFNSTVTTNNSADPGTYTGDRYRARVTYDEISTFEISMGSASSTAYFGLQFAIGEAWATEDESGNPVPVPQAVRAPNLRLTAGAIPNSATFSGTQLSFTDNGELTAKVTGDAYTGTDPELVGTIVDNEVSSTKFDNLKVRYSAGSQPANSEEIVIGSTGIELDDNTTGSFTFSGADWDYEITGSSTKTLEFTTNTGGGNNITHYENLFDALQYINDNPTEETRVFNVIVEDDGYNSPGAEFTVTVLPEANAGQSTVTAESPITTDDASEITVQVKDGAGNDLGSGYDVYLTTNFGDLDGDGQTYTAQTDGNGQVQVDLTSTGIGTATITAYLGTSDSGDQIGTDQVTVNAGAAAKFIVTGSGTQTAGTSQNLTITAYDANDNVATSYVGDRSLTFAGATSAPNGTEPIVTDKDGDAIAFGSATTITFVEGVATVSGGVNGAMTLYKVETASIEVTQGIIETEESDKLEVTVSAGALNNLAITTQPDGGASGELLDTQPELELRDAYGNVLTGDSSTEVTVSIQSGDDGSLGGTLTQTAENGVVTFDDVTLAGLVGEDYVLRFTDGTRNVDSDEVTVTVGSADSMTMNEQPATSTAGQVIAGPPSVIITDGAGNPVSGIEVTVSLNENTFASGDITITTDANGIAEFDDLVINTADTGYQLTFNADASGVDNVNSGTFNINPGPAASIELTGGTGDLASGSDRTLTATIKDAAGNTVTSGDDSDQDVIFSKSGGAGTVTGLQTVAAENGVATIELTGALAGSVTIEAEITSTASNSYSDDLTFDITTALVTPTITDPDNGDFVNADGASTLTVAGTAVGATDVKITITDSDNNTVGPTTVTVNDDAYTNDFDVSGLDEGELTIEVVGVDDGGNEAGPASVTITMDTQTPSGYSVAWETDPINVSNEEDVDFTISDGEDGTTYNYTISSDGGGTNVTNSGTMDGTTAAITGVDVSGLGDGTLTVSVTLTDAAGNEGSSASDEVTKDTSAPVVTADQTFSYDENQEEGYEIGTVEATDAEGVTEFEYIGGASHAEVSDYIEIDNNGVLTLTTEGVNAATNDFETGSNAFYLSIRATDAAGNASSDVLVTVNVTDVDEIAPTVENVTSAKANGSYTTGEEIDITIEFSESVTVTTDDGTPSLELETGTTNRSATYVSGSGGTTLTFRYTVQAGDESTDLDYAGTGSLSLNGGTIQDGTGNNATPTLASPGDEGSLGDNKALVIDTSAPTVTINDLTTNDTTPTITGTSNEPEGSEVTVTINGETYDGTVDGAGNWSVTVTDVLGEDEYTSEVSITDDAGNETTETGTVTIDTTAPTVAIQNAPETVNSTDAFEVTFEFSEDVSGFVVGDITVTNGSASNFTAVDGDTYTADITPDGEGDLAIDVPAGVANDEAGNGNTAATQESISYDATAPTVAIQNAPEIVNSTDAFEVTFEFSEDVTGFVVGDITVTNGSASNFTAVDGDTYTADITPDGEGDISIDVAAGVANDEAGNGNTAATQESISYDATAPTVAIQNAPETVNSTDAFEVTFEFSEDVTGFVVGDITVTNGSAGNFTAVDGDTYTADITPDGEGDISIDVAAGVANDEAGNGNTAATQESISYDATAPTLTVNDLQTNHTTPTITGTSDENGGTVTVTIDGETYTGVVDTEGDWSAEVTNPLADNDYTASATISDEAGNETTDTATITIDTTSPSGYSVTWNSDPVNLQNEENGTFTISDGEENATFTYEITSAEGGDPVTDTGTITDAENHQVSGLDLSGLNDGELTLSVTLTDALDNEGNEVTDQTDKNTAAPRLASIERFNPTDELTNVDALTFRAIFSENVTGVGSDDFTVSGATGVTINVAQENSTTYDITLSAGDLASVDGVVSVSLDEPTIEDSFSNPLTNNAATGDNESYTLDNTPPVIESIVLQGTPDEESTSITFEVTFSEHITGFNLDGFSVETTSGNATGDLNGFTGEDDTYVVTINNLDGLGDLRLDFAHADDDAITDLAENAIAEDYTGDDTHSVNIIGPINLANSSVSIDPEVLSAGAISTITIILRDRNNNPITGREGADFSFDLTGSASLVTDSFSEITDGNYVTEVTNEVAEIITSTISVQRIETKLKLLEKQIRFTAAAANAGNTTLSATPSEITADGTDESTVTITVRDGFDNIRTDGGDDLFIATTHGDLTAITDNNDGTYTATLTGTTIGDATLTGYLGTDENGDEIGTDTVTLISGSAAQLAFDDQPKTTSVAGDDIGTVTVSLEDASGNLVETDGISITLAISDEGTLVGTATQTTTEGVATFSDLYVEEPGTEYTLTATSDGLTPDDSDAFEITRRAITLTSDSKTKTYGNADPAFTYEITSGSLITSVDLIGNIERAEGENVGAYAIQRNDMTNANNPSYDITFVANNLTITPKDLALSEFVADDKTYDGTTNVTGDGFDDDRLNDDDLTFDYDVVFADASAGTGKEVNFTSIEISGGDDAGNYTLVTTSETATANIDQAELTVTGATADDKTYDGTNEASITGATLNGVINDDDVALDALVGSFDDANAANDIEVTAALTLTGDDTGNYSLTQPTGLSAHITPLELTIAGEFTANDKPYDGDRSATFLSNDLTLVGVVGADTEDVELSDESIEFTSAEAGEDLEVSIISADLSGTQSDNYTLSLDGAPTAVADITKQAPTIAAWPTASNITYGQTLGESTLSGGDADGTFAFTDESDEPTTVGTYSAEVTFTPTDSDNFTTATQDVDVEVGQKELTISEASAENKTYDGDTDASITGATLNGVINDDDVALDALVGSFADANVANDIEVTAALTLTGDDTGNYSLTQPTGLSANITPLELTIAGEFTVADKPYDGDKSATFLSNELTLVGVVGADTEDVELSDESIEFASAEAGEEIEVSIISADLSGTQSDNYTLSLDDAPTAVADITKQNPTITAWPTASGITYGETLTQSTLTGGTEEDELPGTFSFADDEIMPGSAGTYQADVIFTPTDSDNYAAVTGTEVTDVEVAQKTLTITVNDASRAADEGDPTFTLADFTAGLATGDAEADVTSGDVTFVLASTDANSTTGVYEDEIGLDETSLDGAKASNYDITIESGDLEIIPASLAGFDISGIADPTVAGTTHTITITARDTEGNIKTDYTGTVTFSSSDASADLPTDYTFTGADDGVVSFTDQVALKTAGEQWVQVEDATDDTKNGRQEDITVTHADAETIAVSTISDQTVGVGFGVTFTVQDAYDNTVTDFTGDIDVDIEFGTITPNTFAFSNSDNGERTAGFTLDEAGDMQQISAEWSNDASVSGESNSFDVETGKGALLVITTQPVGGASGAELPIQPVVEIRDIGNNLVSTDSETEVTVSIFSGENGTLTGTQTVTADEGVVTYSDLTLAGLVDENYVLRFTAAGLVEAKTYDFNSLSTGNLAGQDNWTLHTGSDGSSTIETNAADGTLWTRYNRGAGAQTASSRVNDEAFAFTSLDNSDAKAVFQADVYVGFWGIEVWTGFDQSGDGTISGSERGPGFTVGSNGGELGILAPGGNEINGGYTEFSRDDWLTLKLEIDLLANDGEGSGTLYLQNLSEGDTEFEVVAGLENVNLGLDRSATDGRSFTRWNGVDFDISGATHGLNNISLGKESTTRSNDVNVTVGAPELMAIETQPENSVSGENIVGSPAVVVTDAKGNKVPDVDITVAVNQNQIDAGTTTQSTDATGIAEFDDLQINTSDTGYILEFSTDADGVDDVSSTAFDITAGNASQLAFVEQPSNATAGDVIDPSITVQLLDANENAVNTDDVDITLTISGEGTLAGTVTQSTTNGVATFSDLYVEEPGTEYTLTATSDGLTPDDSDAFEITRRAITLTADAASKTYGDADPDFTYELTSGDLITGVELTGDLDRAEAEDAGTYAITQGGLTNANNPSYDITFSPADLTITAKDLKLTNFVADDKTYDGTTGVTGDGFEDDRLNDDELTFDYDVVFADASAGTGKEVNFTSIEISGGGDAGNYTLVTTSGTATADIDHAELTITGATADDKTYDGDTEASISGATLDGVINEDDVELDALVGSFDDANVANDIEVTAALTLTGDDTGNYTLTQPTGLTADITKSALTITVEDASRKAGAADPAFGFADFGGSLATGDVAADVTGGAGTAGDVTFTLSATDTDSEPGEYTDEISIDAESLDGAKSGNYDITMDAGTLTIVPADLGSFLVEGIDDPTQAGTANTVQVTALDTEGNVKTDYIGTVTFSSSDEEASLPDSYTFVAGDNGAREFENEVTFETAGAHWVQAADGDVSDRQEEIDVNAGPVATDNAGTLIEVITNDITANGTDEATVRATLLDEYDNPVPGVTVSFASTGEASIGTATGTSDTNGQITATLTNTTAETVDVTARYDSNNDATADTDITNGSPAEVTFVAGDAANLAIDSGNNQSDVVTESLDNAMVVLVTDAEGNPVPNETVSFTISSTPADATGETLSATTVTMDADGKASTGLTLGTKTGEYEVTASVTDLEDVVFEATATPGAASQLAFATQPTDATAGEDMDPAVTVQLLDEYENDVADTGTEISLTISGGATLSGSTELNTDNGVAGFSDLKVAEAGTYTLTAASTGLDSDESVSFTINAGAPDAIVMVTQPENTTAGEAVNGTPTVRVEDNQGNVLEGVEVSVALSENDFTTSSTLTLETDENGEAEFDNLIIETAQTDYTLTFSTADVAALESNAFEVTPAEIFTDNSTLSADPTSLTAGEITTATVTLADEFGNIISGVTDFDISLSGDATIDDAIEETETDGTYSFTVTNNTAEEITISVDANEIEIGSEDVEFVVGEISAANSSVSANPDTLVADGTAASTLTIELEDALGNAVPNQAGNIELTGLSSAVAGTILETETEGTYEVELTNTTAEDIAVTVTADDIELNDKPEITFEPGAISATQSSVEATSPHTADGTEASTITITLRDTNDNVITGIAEGDFSLTYGDNATLANFTEAGDGEYTFELTNTVAEDVDIVVEADEITLDNQPTVTFQPGAISASESVVQATSPHTANGADSSVVTVELKDANENPISGIASDDFTISVTGDATAGVISETGTAGTYEFEVTNTIAEDVTVSVTADGIDLDSEPDITFEAGVATEFVIAGNDTQVAGESQDLTITAFDANGNVATGYTGDKGLTFTGASESPDATSPTVSDKDGNAVEFDATTTITFNAGIATVNTTNNGAMILYAAESANIGVTDGVISEKEVLNVIVNAANTEALSFIQQPEDADQDAIISPDIEIQLLDAFGNVMEEAGIDISISLTGVGTLNGTLNTTTDNEGIAQFDDLSISESGEYELLASSAGLESAESDPFEIKDITPPLLTVNNQETNNPTPTITGTSDELGGTVTVTIDGETYTGTVEDDGIWSIEVTNELEDDEYTVTASIEDEAGNQTGAEATLIIDVTGPQLTVNDQQTNDNTPVVNGTTDAAAGSEVTITIDGESYTGIAGSSGNWSIEVTNTLEDGEYTVTASISDELGNTTEATATLEIDSTAPLLTISDQQTNNNTPAITGTTDAAEGRQVTVEVDGTPYMATVEEGGTWSIQVTDELSDDIYTVTATISDEFGNTTEATGTLIIDASGPALAVNGQQTNNSIPVITGTTDAQAGTEITVVIDGETYTTVANANGTWSVQVTEALSDGSYSVTATVTDEFGNTTEATGQLVINATAPSLTINSQQTNDNTPAITGTTNAPVDSEVSVTINGQTYTGTVSGDGTWSVQVSDELEDGEYSATATVADESGNEAEVTGTVVINTSGPQLIVDDLQTNDNTPTITGTTNAPAGSEVTVTIDGETYTGTVATDGTWSIEVTNELEDDEYIITASISDELGNTTEATATLIIDASAPLLTVIDQQTNDNTPTITGTTDAPAGSEVVVTINGQIYTVTVSGDGTWSVEVSDELEDDEYTVTASITDEFGNTSEATGTILIDATGPALTVNGQQTNDNTPTITGTTDAPAGSEVTVTIDGETYTGTVSGDGTWSVEVSDELEDDEYTVTASITDEMGNTSEATGTIVIDATGPALTVNGQQTNNPTPTITGTTSAPAGSEVTVTIDGETYTGTVSGNGTWSVEVTDPLANNSYKVTATVSDGSGNQAQASTTIVIGAPGPQLVVSDQQTNDNTPTITGTTDAPAGSEVTVTINGQNYTAVVGSEGDWSIEVSTPLADGQYTITASVSDELGNTTEVTAILTIDTIGPAITVNSLNTGNRTPIITGTSEAPAGSEVTVTLNDQTYTAFVEEDGSWSVETTSELADGQYQVTASVTDSFGNQGQANGLIVINVVQIGDILITANPTQISADGVSESIITVRLFNTAGERISQSSGTIELFTDNGTISEVIDNENGTYTALLTSSTNVGTAIISGTMNGEDIADTAEVEFTRVAGRLVILSGNGQSQQVNTSLEEPLVAAIYDTNDQPIQEVPLTFTIVKTPEDAQNQSLSENTVTTGSDGASVSLDLGTKSGEYQIEVRAAGVDTVLFRQYAIAGPLASFEIIGGNEQEQATLSVLDDSLAVQMMDEFQNPIINEPVLFEISDSPTFSRGSEFDPETAFSNQNGEARTSFRMGDVGGEYRISAQAAEQDFAELEFIATAIEKRPNPTVLDTVNTVVFNGDMNTFMYADQSESLDNMQSFTTEIWVLPDSLTDYYELFNKAGDEESPQFIIWGEGNQIFATIYLEDGSEVTINAGNVFERIFSPEGSVNKVNALNEDSAYTWTHLALSVDDEEKTMDMYKNGFRVAQANFESDLNQGSSQLQMGRGFSGEVHEVRVWDMALSRATIQSRMTQILAGTEDNLILYNTFDDEGGDVAEDQTNNGNDLRLGGGVQRNFSIRGIPNIEMNENEEYIMAFKDVDEFGDELTTIITELPDKGKLYQVVNGDQQGAEITSVPTTLNDEKNRALYIPDRNYFGSDSLGFRLEDIFENRTDAVRNITIYSVYRSPAAFPLIYPSVNDTLFIDVRDKEQMVDFNWGLSEAYGNAGIEYILTLWNKDNEEEMYEGLSDTTYAIDMKKSILNYNETFTWRVQATDGRDTTESISSLTFVITREQPLVYQLHQNYPNPFNPSTNVEYWVPVTSQVRIEIFDLLGRRVQILVDQERVTSGTYQAQWDAGSLASGIYYYRMTAVGVNGSRFVKMKQMMLIK